VTLNHSHWLYSLIIATKMLITTEVNNAIAKYFVITNLYQYSVSHQDKIT